MSASSSLAVRRVVSATPGRIRIRDRTLRNPGRLADLEAALAEQQGILETSANPGAGSLVLHFDQRRIAVEELETLVDATLDRLLATPAPTGKSRRRQINRLSHPSRAAASPVPLMLTITVFRWPPMATKPHSSPRL